MPYVDIDRGDDRIALVTLNRPARLNAMSVELISDVKQAFAELEHDRSVAAVVLTGAGRGFCSGTDLQGSAEPAPDAEGRGRVGAGYRTQEHMASMMLAIHECAKPVVAAVHGAAVGGGLAMALAADCRVATPDSRFGAVFIKVGLSACDAGVSYLLPRIVGVTRASELMLTGRHFSGEEAMAFGMLNRLVPEGEHVEAARELARQIAENNEFGLYMTKRGLASGIDAPSLRQAIEMENRTQILASLTGNLEEAMAAFVEKRPPTWGQM